MPKQELKVDLIGDVLLQADAAKLKLATKFLKDLSKQGSTRLAAGNFDKTLQTMDGKSPSAQSVAKFEKDRSRVPGSEEGADFVADAKGKTRNKEAMRGLEAVLATKMVEAMMPKDQSRIYGEGTAGDIWRSMHTEVMGKALADRGLFTTSIEPQNGVDASVGNARKVKAIVPFAG
jgi:peptidoglycan hydrolase FlgJ